MKKEYQLGNVLRGWFNELYESETEAFTELSKIFISSFPCQSGKRYVQFYVYGTNERGLTFKNMLYQGYTDTTGNHKPQTAPGMDTGK